MNGTFSGLDHWSINNTEWVTHTVAEDYFGEDGSADFVKGGEIEQDVDIDQAGLWFMRLYAKADDPDCRILHCLGETCYNSPLNDTDWTIVQLGEWYDQAPGVVSALIQWSPIGSCDSTELYVDDVQVWREPDPTATPTPTVTPTPSRTPTPIPSGTPTLALTWTPTPLPELPWITENPYFSDWDYAWRYREPQTFLCTQNQPYFPCFRMRRFGELRQTFGLATMARWLWLPWQDKIPVRRIPSSSSFAWVSAKTRRFHAIDFSG